jgi:hypothetical protein
VVSHGVGNYYFVIKVAVETLNTVVVDPSALPGWLSR